MNEFRNNKFLNMSNIRIMAKAVSSCLAIIRVHTRQGNVRKFKFFQGQGIVRDFYVVSGKNECFLKCQ